MTGRAILFDMDGVVLEGRSTDPSVYADAADAALDRLGVEPTPDQRRTLRSHGYDGIERCCRSLGVEPSRFWRLREERADAIGREWILTGRRDTYDDVDSIRELPGPLALVSNNRHGFVSLVAEHLGLPFEAVRGREPTPAGFRRQKPRPDYLLETMADLGVDGGRYVGDRRTDMIAAERAGLEGVYLRRPHNHGETLPPEASEEIDSLAALE